MKTKAIITGALFALAPLAASAVTFDFESGIPAEFGGGGTIESVGALAGQNGFAGSYLRNTGRAADATTVAVSGLAAHDTVTLNFDLALIDSWDGIGSGGTSPDYFNLVADGVEVFEISVGFPGRSGSVEQVPASATNRINSTSNIVGSNWRETLFTVELSFAHTGSDLALSLFADGSGWQAGNDESWGIDNLSITTSGTPAVPLPASLPLLLAGVAGLGALRRRG